MAKRKLVLFVEPSEVPVSERHANEAALALWKEIAGKSALEIRSLRISAKAGQWTRHLPLLMRAHRIVFPSYSPAMVEALRFLRARLHLGVPAVFHLHGRAIAGPGFFYAHSRYLQAHDQFLVTSAAESRILERFYRHPRKIQVPFLPKCARPRHSARKWKECRRFVYVGRISRQKNLGALIRAFALLERSHPDENFELWIFGKDDRLGIPEFGVPGKAELAPSKRLARELGVRGIRWKGFVDQKRLDRGVLREPHVFVSPSIHLGENFGLAAFRSLAMGNPAVLSAWGGHLDFKSAFGRQVRLVDVVQGARMPEVDPHSLADAMHAVWSARGTGFAAQARKIVRRLHSRSAATLKKSLRVSPDPSPLKTTPEYDRLMRRIVESSGRKPVYSGYLDPLCRPVLRAMGLKTGAKTP